MASIKVKFRPSTNENKEGTIYYQVIQNRVIRQLKMDYRLFIHEWNEDNNAIVDTNNSRQNYLRSIEERIDWDIKRLQSIINQLENKRVRYTADDVISTFQKQANEQSLFNFMQGGHSEFSVHLFTFLVLFFCLLYWASVHLFCLHFCYNVHHLHNLAYLFIVLGFTQSFGVHIIVLPFYLMKNVKCEMITLF